jgi:hypothetical protein
VAGSDSSKPVARTQRIWNQSFGGQQGFHLNMNHASGISNAGAAPNAQSRNVKTLRIENTLSWLKGNHNFSFGGSFDRLDSWNKFRATVPTILFEVVGLTGTNTARVVQLVLVYVLLRRILVRAEESAAEPVALMATAIYGLHPVGIGARKVGWSSWIPSSCRRFGGYEIARR